MVDLTGTAFQASEVAEAYVHRPPYAPLVFDCLADQAVNTNRLLDLGCGEGKIARPMARVFDQVVAIDPSAAMIALGKSLENGDATNLGWVQAKAEEAKLEGLFDMVTFASSIHWMTPESLFANLRPHLSPDYCLAIVSGDEAFEPVWGAAWQQFLEKWVPIASGLPMGSSEWQDTRDRHLDALQVLDTFEFLSGELQQSVESYILCQHSRNTFTLAKLGARVTTFRQELMDVLAPFANAQGQLSYQVKTRVTLARLQP